MNGVTGMVELLEKTHLEQPGDLLYWGDRPSSIYHVALYVGDGMMIHAPRSGRNVEEVSMYYWITPSYFSRP